MKKNKEKKPRVNFASKSFIYAGIIAGGLLSGGVLSWLYVLTHPKVSRVGHWVSESITAMIWEKVHYGTTIGLIGNGCLGLATLKYWMIF